MAIITGSKAVLAPGQWATCPHCGAPTLTASPREEGYQQCFSFSCGLRAVPPALTTTGTIFETVYREMHLELLREGSRAKAFLANLGAHAAVIARAPVGEVPPDYDVAARFAPHLEQGQARLQALEDQRPSGRPTNSYLFAVAAAQAHLQHLREVDAECRQCVDLWAGWLACFYESSDHTVQGIGFINPAQPEERTTLMLEPAMGTFGHAMFPAGRVPEGLLLGPELFVVADELELLLLQSLMARRAEEHGLGSAAGCLFACATGTHVDAGAVRRLSGQPILCYQATPDGRALVEALRREVNLFGFSPPGECSLTELLGKADAFDLLKTGAAAKLLFTRPFAKVRDEVDDDRCRPKTPPFLKHGYAGQRVLRDLQERGRLYWDGRMPYAFLHDTKELVVGDGDHQKFQRLASRYGIAASDQDAYAHLIGAMHSSRRNEASRRRCSRSATSTPTGTRSTCSTWIGGSTRSRGTTSPGWKTAPTGCCSFATPSINRSSSAGRRARGTSFSANCFAASSSRRET